ncbi:MAG TPA: T9SS type A sorting domain-containing protein [Parafilimonas sp.]|nr:T9SS type A sorting domain-containing protein [Parafilimonas sp.]
MKNKLHFFGLAVLCLSATISRAQTDQVMAKNYADILVWSVGVTNPKHAVDADHTNYAVMQADIGIANSATLKLGWSQLGSAGDNVSVQFQNDNGALSLDVLQSMTIAVFDSNDQLVGRKQGFDFSDATAVQGTSRYTISIKSRSGALNIAAVRIRISGLLSTQNRIRVYYASEGAPCPPIRGGSVNAQHNVTNANNAVSADPNDYAILTPPLALDDSYLDLAFSTTAPGGHLVGFKLGEGNVVLSAQLLQNITLTVYDTDGGVVASQSGFALSDADVLGGGRFNLTLPTPAGSYQVARGRVRLAGLLNVLTTMNVYDIVAHVPCNTQPVALNNASQGKIDLHVYPNPFHDYATLNFKGVANNSYRITITDKTGAIVEERIITGSTSTRILEKAPVGVYFVKISSGDVTETRKVMKL